MAGKCKEHNLAELLRVRWDHTGEVDAVVRWCTKCGAVVIDGEVDHRIMPGRIMKMRLPSPIKESNDQD